MTSERTPIDDALARLRESTDVPPVDAGREQALLTAFDAYWVRPRPTARRWVWVWPAAAASVVGAIVLNQLAVNNTPRLGPPVQDAAIAGTDFVPWPGAHALPPFESGELRRVDLPLSALPALGLLAPPSAGSIVQAELVIGQDGLARAVRLVQQQE